MADDRRPTDEQPTDEQPTDWWTLIDCALILALLIHVMYLLPD